MRYSSKFTEETFGLFITVAFSYDGMRTFLPNISERYTAIKPLAEYFDRYFCNHDGCQKDAAILYLISYRINSIIELTLCIC